MITDSAEKSGNLRGLDLRLPPLPRTLPEVLKLLHEPGFVSPEGVANVVRNDPAAVAHLLKQINSAYYGLRRSITSVDRAIRMMGPTSAAGTIVGRSMVKMRELVHGPAGSCFTRTIRHSEATAYLSHYLLKQLSPAGDQESGAQPDEEMPMGDGFTEGLLHDFGKVVLIYNYPEKAVQLYEEEREEESLRRQDERRLERMVFGCDHTEAGAYAALEMDFPDVLVDVIRHHHDPDTANVEAGTLDTVRSVSAANLATKALGTDYKGVSVGSHELDWETCGAHPIWRHWADGSSEKDEEPPRNRLMEELRAKRREIVLFTRFFLDDSEIPSPAGPVL